MEGQVDQKTQANRYVVVLLLPAWPSLNRCDLFVVTDMAEAFPTRGSSKRERGKVNPAKLAGLENQRGANQNKVKSSQVTNHQ
jgi:hypothetical protein